MSKQQKPVWRVNVGAGVPSDLGDEAIYRDGFVSELCGREKEIPSLWIVYDHTASYSAYKTTRTKAAKYERSECAKCGGNGALAFQKAPDSSSVVIGSNWIEECKTCNGKGYTLEAIK